MESTIAHDCLALGRLPERHARYRPRHAAVIAPAGAREVRLDWREFDAYVNRWANALASLGVSRGDRVATLLPNSIELVASYWACFNAGDGGVVRLNEDGSADAGFHGVQLENPAWGWTSVRAILPLADGRIVIVRRVHEGGWC